VTVDVRGNGAGGGERPFKSEVSWQTEFGRLDIALFGQPSYAILTDDLNDLRRTAKGRWLRNRFLNFAVMSGADSELVWSVFVNSDCDPTWATHQGTRVWKPYQGEPTIEDRYAAIEVARQACV
jgi:hypothetical protein